MRRTLCFLILLSSIIWVPVPLTLAWEQPAGFRDIPWGASRQSVQQHLPSLYCSQNCRGNLMIGTVQVYADISFITGGMDTIVLIFPSDNFPEIRETFLARYGEPTSRRNPRVQNRMGAQFENETLQWAGDRVDILLTQYGPKLTHAQAVLATAEAQRFSTERNKEKGKTGKNDL